jgi:hypothetical protein
VLPEFPPEFVPPGSINVPVVPEFEDEPVVEELLAPPV